MLEARNLTKTFVADGVTTKALQDVSLTINQGDFVSIVGRSGSGKTTLLNVLSTLLEPDTGTLSFAGTEITSIREKALNKLRHNEFAVIFQFHHLMPYLSAEENVLLPFMNRMRPITKSLRERAKHSLERVGLADKASKIPGALSGGEQQRVAIARALVRETSLLFADEPTGSLDSATGETIMQLLHDLNDDGLTIAMVTHNEEYASSAPRIIRMQDGRIVE